MNATLPDPHTARAALLERLQPVGEVDSVPLPDAAGRVLARPIVADRPSPPHDVSAMDGYALRLADAAPGRWIPVAAEARMGQAPPPCPTGHAIQVSTGAATPPEVEAVIRREDTDEEPGRVRIRNGVSPRSGQSVRRAGENAPAGATVVPAGARVAPGVAAAAVTFGASTLHVRRRVRVVALITGDEFSDNPAPWQIRESNGHTIRDWCASRPHVELLRLSHVPDTREATVAAMREAAADADLVLSTGGVSMGDRDHVPPAAAAAGFEAVYHRVAMRPGKPNLGAVHPGGAVLLGLPGNPVSVLCGLAVFAEAVALRLAGGLPESRPRVCCAGESKPLALTQFLPAAVDADGTARPLMTRGSGDLAALAQTTGFLEVPPDATLGNDAPWWPAL